MRKYGNELEGLWVTGVSSKMSCNGGETIAVSLFVDIFVLFDKCNSSRLVQVRVDSISVSLFVDIFF